MNKKKYRIGFVGAGGIAESRHIPNLKKIDGVELVAVANRSLASGKRAAEKFGFHKVYETWQDVIQDPDVEIVFVCTPPYLHREISCYALSHGKHVFSQARMAMDLEDARIMLEADQKTSLTTMLCPPPTYMKVEPYVIQYIADGHLGAIRHVSLQHVTSSVNDPNLPLHWRQRRDMQGINMLDVGIMGEVLNKWFGPLHQLSALGKIWTEVRPADRDGKTVVDQPDSVAVIGEFASGSTLNALFSGAAAGGSSTMTIHGDRGTLICDHDKTSLIVRDGQGERVIEVPEEQVRHWTVEADFLRAIDEGKKGDPSFTDGVKYMAFTQAIMDSLQQVMTPIKVQQM